MADTTEQQQQQQSWNRGDKATPPEQGGDKATPPVLRDVLAPLLDIPISQRPFAVQHLLSCLNKMEWAQQQLRSRKGPEEEALSDQDSILLCWLSAIYDGVSGSQAIIHGELLQPDFTASGMVAPFVQPAPAQEGADGTLEPSTAARFGVPSSTDVLCDNVSELLRMAAAAVISLYVYLNFQQGPGDLPADEVALTFATVAIHSCADAANAAAIDKQMQGLIDADVKEPGGAFVWQQQQQQQHEGEQQPGNGSSPQQFGCAQVRWLMHYVRGLVTHYMAAVQHLLGNREAQAECYHAQQKDMQYMCKALPNHPLGYSLFARCAMNGQQMQVAEAFLSKGLAVAKAVNADTSIATMSFQRAAAVVLGGAGPRIDAGEVQELLQQGEQAREAVLSWFPAPWKAAAEDGEPDRSLVLQKLLPEFERRSGAALPSEGQVDAMTGLLYVTRPAASIPAGAVQHLAAEGEVETVVEEGVEE